MFVATKIREADARRSNRFLVSLDMANCLVVVKTEIEIVLPKAMIHATVAPANEGHREAVTKK